MGMIACYDCKEIISTSARICPKCGCQIRRTSMLVKILLAIMIIGLLASFILPSAKAAAPEIVSVYLGEAGSPKVPVNLRSSTAVVYAERRCNLETIQFFQKMKYATMSGVPVCAFKSGQSVFFFGAGNPIELPDVFFAVARVIGNDTAEVIDQGYDGKRAAQEYINQQRATIQRQTIGAQKPPRESGRHADN